MSLLLVDIGTGTQDILVYSGGRPVEQCPKMVMPSPTLIRAAEIGEATLARRAVFLEGVTMGGGPIARAVKRHLHAGLEVYAIKEAAYTLHDSLDRVRDMGVKLVEKAPERGAVRIVTTDFMERELREALRLFGIDMPSRMAFAVQDHGFSSHRSNRLFRFEVMKDRLEKGDWALSSLLSDPPPVEMSRMQAVRKCAPDALVIDTGPAAVFGMLMDPVVKKMAGRGVTLVNAGSSHTLCFTLEGEEVGGIFEHHTFGLTTERLMQLIRKLEEGTLTNEEIFGEGGHGAAVHYSVRSTGIAVTGPNRRLLLPDAYPAAPFGDMMLTGCFGLLEAWRRLRGEIP
ncbi:MAG: DUF1786 domain-containing protein [Methanomicrobiales archaeon]|nr:DUF1786 domain-containing protein [Methanomicrobiales archaeon]